MNPSDPSVQSADVPTDYFDYFFIRSQAAGGLVMTGQTNSARVVPAPMLAAARGLQLFKCVPTQPASEKVLLVCQQTQTALCYEEHGYILLKPQDPTDQSQQWTFTADGMLGFLYEPNPVLKQGVVGLLDGTSWQLQVVDKGTPTQLFERLRPSDFSFIRNCWTGRILTADQHNGVSWQNLSGDLTSHLQEWGMTQAGFIVNRGTGQVLQVSAPTPSAGLALNLATQVAIGTDSRHQQFDVNALDGCFHSMLDPHYVIAMSGTQAVIQPLVATDYAQLLEVFSPLQFFTLQNQAYSQGHHTWFQRTGGSSALQPQQTSQTDQLFTVSRYGELINRIDGYVMQSLGQNVRPAFVDPAPEPIGFDTTTFVYTPAGATFGSITQRQGGLGLIASGDHSGDYPVMWPGPSGTASQGWSLVGAPGSVFDYYQDLSQQFFANPAPLPGTPPLDELPDPAVVALVSQLDKTPKVIIALITGMLDIGANISVGSVADQTVTWIATKVLGNADVAAKVAVIMQGTVTAASIIAVADGITKAGLWWQIFKAILPNSFWGWTLTIAKLSLSIASWAFGIGPAVMGAKIVLLIASILLILKEGTALASSEAALLEEHVARLQAVPQPA